MSGGNDMQLVVPCEDPVPPRIPVLALRSEPLPPPHSARSAGNTCETRRRYAAPRPNGDSWSSTSHTNKSLAEETPPQTLPMSQCNSSPTGTSEKTSSLSSLGD
ncbi:hypothetical protein BD413DRAFT_544183 [Trametes elegans]|nr:hypothetical protein BD413DRAFT_544183 [Trametes elegans]